MREQWNELKETIIELRDSKGTCTQQEVCQFLANYMNVLETQMEQIKGKSLDEITEAHEEIGYEKGYRDGYAQAVEDSIKVVGLNTWAGSRITELQTAQMEKDECKKQQ